MQKISNTASLGGGLSLIGNFRTGTFSNKCSKKNDLQKQNAK